MTAYEYLKEHAREDAEIIYGSLRITVGRLIQKIDAFASRLSGLGLVAGDVLTIYLPTSLEGVVAFYACSKAGVVASFVHPRMPLKKLDENMRETKSRALMYLDVFLPMKKSVPTAEIFIKCTVAQSVCGILKPFYGIYSLAVSRVYGGKHSFSQMTKGGNSAVKGKGGDTVAIMHSGGTGGAPKLVCLSNDALNSLAHSLAVMHARKVDDGEFSLGLLPIFHAYGLGVSVHTALTIGLGLILHKRFSAKGAIDEIRRRNVTFVAGVPVMFKKMLSEKSFAGAHLKKLIDIWGGGDFLDEGFVQRFDEVIRKNGGNAQLMRGYGLTETSSACAVNCTKHYKAGSCGLPLPDMEIKIIGEDEKPLPPGQIGEIEVYSGAIMQGYLDGACEEAFRGGDDKIRTGDLGYLDDEGYLFVTGRKKRTIKINAINVFPSEIEEAALKSGLVEDACAVGYLDGGKVCVRLFVVPKAGLSNDKVKKQLTAVLSENLFGYSVPRVISVRESLPRTSLGKIDYRALENEKM